MSESQDAASHTHRRLETRATEIAALQPDMVSPHDKEALKALAETWDVADRLPNLIRGAAQSRGLAKVHSYVAWQCIRAARRAQKLGDKPTCREYLDGAREARRKAFECNQFARQCERKANVLAGSSGSRATPRR